MAKFKRLFAMLICTTFIVVPFGLLSFGAQTTVPLQPISVRYLDIDGNTVGVAIANVEMSTTVLSMISITTNDYELMGGYFISFPALSSLGDNVQYRYAINLHTKFGSTVFPFGDDPLLAYNIDNSHRRLEYNLETPASPKVVDIRKAGAQLANLYANNMVNAANLEIDFLVYIPRSAEEILASIEEHNEQILSKIETVNGKLDLTNENIEEVNRNIIRIYDMLDLDVANRLEDEMNLLDWAELTNADQTRKIQFISFAPSWQILNAFSGLSEQNGIVKGNGEDNVITFDFHPWLVVTELFVGALFIAVIRVWKRGDTK